MICPAVRVVPAPTVTVSASTSIPIGDVVCELLPAVAEPEPGIIVPPSSSEPGCQLSSTAPETLTAPAGAASDAVPMKRSEALISMGAASPPLAAAVSTCPVASREFVTDIESEPASAGKFGRGAPALLAAALKNVDARLSVYAANVPP